MATPEIAWTPLVIQTLTAAVLSGSVVGIVLKTIIDRRLEKERINREWKEKALSTLIGPLVMHLFRTDALSHLYQSTFNKKTRSYFHAQLMRESNKAVRSLLLANGHLLPSSLITHAKDLIEHYDVWLARFDEKETLEKPGPESMFDMGFVEVRFPLAARDAFFQEYGSLRNELYGVGAPIPSFQRTASSVE
jgi:hypothetical protein